MKLKELLKVISYLEEVQILIFRDGDAKTKGTDEIVFDGSVFDVPWTYADCELDNNSGDDEAVFTFIDEKGNSKIGIYIVEE